MIDTNTNTNTIKFSKAKDPSKWDMPEPVFECKTNEDALKAQIFFNGLISKIDELERKLKIAEDGLEEIIGWSDYCDHTGMAGGFAIAKQTLKQIRGE